MAWGYGRSTADGAKLCRMCRAARSKRELLIPTPLPAYPWQVVGTDLFELNREQYLLVVYYFSRYPEFVKLASTTSANVIAILKAMFARHGVPETVRSDNGPQFAPMEFTQFAREYGFLHEFSQIPTEQRPSGKDCPVDQANDQEI